ncbi:hypothetical protein MBLNU230_g0679t1 [Neophaeotheca triangularis]
MSDHINALRHRANYCYDCQRQFQNANNYQANLSAHDCIAEYSRSCTHDADFATYKPFREPYNWIYTDVSENRAWGYVCKIDSLLEGASYNNWTIKGATIDYCMSRLIHDRCKLQGSFGIMVAVIASNVVKLSAMLWGLFGTKMHPLVTIGDALASFIEYADDWSRGTCLMSRKTAPHPAESERIRTALHLEPTPYKTPPKPQRWHAAVSPYRWVFTIGLIAIALIVTLPLLGVGISDIKSSGASISPSGLVRPGFGRVDPRLFIDSKLPNRGVSALVQQVIPANCPQAIVSCLYLAYNNLYTAMYQAHEWRTYAKVRKGLRVTSPRGSQYSTFWLQFPYYYLIPLILISGTLH